MAVAMYRLFLMTLYISTSVAAPESLQDNSNITYIEVTPRLNNELNSNITSREFEVENITLTVLNNTSKDHIVNNKREENKSESNYPDRIISTISTTESNINKENITKLDKIDDTNEPKKNNEVVPINKIPVKNDSILIGLPDHKESITDHDTSESQQTNRIAADSSNSNNQIQDNLASEDGRSKTATSNYEENTNDLEAAAVRETTVITIVEDITKAPLRKFIPKLSHFGKSIGLKSNPKNLISGLGKRKFISRCKCEKIWNCPKLQISVGRCPEEYFLCCS